MKFKNVFYFSQINKIGGVETFYWNLVQKYKDWDIAIVYKTADPKQVARLRKYVRVIKFTGQTIECEKAFFNYNLDIIDYVEAQEYFQILHGDYKAFRIRPVNHPKVQRHIGVSQLVCDSYTEITGLPCECAYNPFVVRKPKKVLHLISATRLTYEKGKDRMVRLGEVLDQSGITYTWTIFTDDTSKIANQNIIYRKPILDIIDYIADADYLVQLSDHEGYCYSVVEALSVGTPVIVTDCKVFREIGVVDGKNGFVLDFGMQNIPVQKIIKGLPDFKYVPLEDKWGELLAEGANQYITEKDAPVMVRCIATYHDLQLGRLVKEKEVITVTRERADTIIENGLGEYV